MKKYPYYVVDDIELLEKTSDEAEAGKLRRRIAVNIGEPHTLERLLGTTAIDFNNFYPDQQQPELNTDDTITAFLNKFSSAEVTPVDESTEIPMVPAADYLTILEMEEKGEKVPLPPIEKTPKIHPTDTPKADEQPTLTESFAKILIKNGNYTRALEIITELSLKNSEKNIYFADQKRFLQRLIRLQQKSGGERK